MISHSDRAKPAHRLPDGRELTTELQIGKWVEGEPLCPNTNGECCPDFSCCLDGVDTTRMTREAFRDADETRRFGMLGMFLTGAFAQDAKNKSKAGTGPAKKVYLAGLETGEEPS